MTDEISESKTRYERLDPNVIQALLSVVELSLDMQHAFKSLPQPATATIRGVLCHAGATFHSFSYESTNSMWHYYGDGTTDIVGEKFDQVVSKCSLNRLKPCLLLYQVRAYRLSSNACMLQR